MDIGNIIFSVIDVVIVILLVFWVKTSRKVIVEAKSGSKLIFSMMFYFVAIMSYFQYSGITKWIQTIALLVIGTLFYFVKSGVSEEGVIITGVLTTWNEAKEVTLNYADGCLSLQGRHRPVKLFFDKKQMNEVRNVVDKNRKKK